MVLNCGLLMAAERAHRDPHAAVGDELRLQRDAVLAARLLLCVDVAEHDQLEPIERIDVRD